MNISKSVLVEYHSTMEPDEMSSHAPFSVERSYTTIRGMKSHIRDRIKAARQHAKLSQEKLGELIGVSKSAVSNWETYNPDKFSYPTYENLRLISLHTGAPISWLMDDEAEINADWKSYAEIITFPKADNVIESPRLSDLAIEAARIFDSLPKQEQIQVIHYLRVRIQTTGKAQE